MPSYRERREAGEFEAKPKKAEKPVEKPAKKQTYAVEKLGVGDWPPTEDADEESAAADGA